MKYLRGKKTLKSSNKKLLKRLHSEVINPRTNDENDLLAKSILVSSKTQRLKKHDDLFSKY